MQYDTRAVAGTPAKPPWSSRYAATSRTAPSPGIVPRRRSELPVPGAVLPDRCGDPLGLLGAAGSSSCNGETSTKGVRFEITD